MNIKALLNDFNIPYDETGKNISTGWIGICCPFCGDTSNHLGYNLEENFFSCWRCGGHPNISVISKLLNVTTFQAKSILRQYDIPIIKQKTENVKVQKNIFYLPKGTGPIEESHKRYLVKRGFDPERLEKIWHLKGTGPYGELENINFKHRIIIPYIWNGEIVSFTSRDITGKSQIRYITCPAEYELISLKSILYGKQECWKGTGVLVEGPTDVWRMGTSSFAVSGIKYTNQQIREIVRVFKRVAIMFDNDPQAKLQATKIVAELRFRGVDAFRVDIKGDPGSMDQKEADYLVKQLIH